MKKIKSLLIALLGFIVLVALDQITKILAITHLKNKSPYVIWENVFELHYAENRGAAFSILQDQIVFFIISTSVLICLISFFFYKLIGHKKYRPINCLLVFLLAGAMGNFIDRIRLGYVIDFLYFKLIDFPIFNVADSYITVSLVLLVILLLFVYKEDDFAIFFKQKKEELITENEEDEDAHL